MPKIPEGNIYIGIDPGKSGGLVCIFTCDPYEVRCTPMPETEWDVYNWFRKKLIKTHYRAVIEVVHAMPQQGVSSAFTFGRGYGSVRMACIAAGITLEEVQPRAWQKALGIPPREKGKGGGKKENRHTDWKKRLRDVASSLFPDLLIWQNTTQGFQLSICDALLIAEYNRRKYEGEL